MSPGKTLVARENPTRWHLVALLKPRGPDVVARVSRSGTYPLRAFPLNLSRATCRPGNASPATSRPGYPGFIAGENGNCCSEGARHDLHAMQLTKA
ncbi:hypothetical protein Tco_0021836 [Tanacetum coccineum]